jgi:hypothetical protein
MSMPLTRSKPPTELSASAQVINLGDDGPSSDGAYLRASVGVGRNAGRNAWKWWNEIGEVHYAISRAGRIAGYARYFAAEFGRDGSVVSEIETGQAAEAVDGIFSMYGGTRGLTERYYTLMKVPGDSYLLDFGEDGYHLASPDELDVTSFSRWSSKKDDIKKLKLVTVPGAYVDFEGTSEVKTPFARELDPKQVLGRIWAPSKRWADVPESALHALDVECEALRDLTLSIKAQLRSRFALAGILFLPPGVSMATSAKKNNPRVAGQLTENTLNLILAAMTRNVKTYDDATALVPIILKGTNAEDGERIKHIILDRSIFETDLQLRSELIGRILQSLDTNQDMSKGTSDQSHWASWAAADDERRVAVGPDLEAFCWGLERLAPRPKLKNGARLSKAGNRIGVWYDLSGAAARANAQEDARQAWDRGLISDDAANRNAGFQRMEASSPIEKVRAAGRHAKNPYLELYGTPEFEKVDWEKAALFGKSPGPAADSTGDEPQAGPGEGDPGSPDDRETDVPRTERPA